MENLNILHQANNNGVSLYRDLLIFYIIVASNVTSELFSTKVKTYFKQFNKIIHVKYVYFIVAFTFSLHVLFIIYAWKYNYNGDEDFFFL